MAPHHQRPPERWWTDGDSVAVGAALLAVVAAGATRAAGAPAVAQFVMAASAIAALAVLVGRSVTHLGSRWSPRATAMLHATVGNVPELLFGLFALRAGDGRLVQAAMVGSVLANVLLVLGVACTVGGLRHGTQRFDALSARAVVVLLLVAAGVVAVPSVTSLAHTSVARHEHALSTIASVVLLVVYLGSLLVGSGSAGGADGRDRVVLPAGTWPVAVAAGVLVAASGAAALASDWFVATLHPALRTLGFSPTFTGVVVVAIAGNAVENVGGVVLAARNRMDHAVAVILQSPVQVLLGVFPLLVLVSPALGGGLTLALPSLLLLGVLVGAVVAVAVVVDGESTWVEGLCLAGLYVVVAAAAWWGS